MILRDPRFSNNVLFASCQIHRARFKHDRLEVMSSTGFRVGRDGAHVPGANYILCVI